jgi:hypothetical protein
MGAFLVASAFGLGFFINKGAFLERLKVQIVLEVMGLVCVG